MIRTLSFVYKHPFKLYVVSLALATALWALLFEQVSPHAPLLIRLGVLFMGVAVLTGVYISMTRRNSQT